MSARPILTRMAEAKAKMIARKSFGWMRSSPKAYYLNSTDHDEFMATEPAKIPAIFRNAPTLEFGFDGVPVRTSDSYSSKLYTEAGCAAQVPVE